MKVKGEKQNEMKRSVCKKQVRGSQKEDKIRKEKLTHRLMIKMKVRCAFIIGHSVFYIGISVITISIFLFFTHLFFGLQNIFFLIIINT